MTLPSQDATPLDWDIRLGHTWVKILVMGWFLPWVYTIYDDVHWDWAWDGFGEATVLYKTEKLLPLVLALFAWGLLRIKHGRWRGALLCVLCTGALLAPPLLNEPREFAFVLGAFTEPTGLAAMALLGSMLIAAGNHQQKTASRRGVGAWLAGLGGLMIAAFFRLPSMPNYVLEEGDGAQAPLALFASGPAWWNAWPFLLWLAGFLTLGLLGVASALDKDTDSRFARRVQGGISGLSRILPITLPLILLAMSAWSGLAGLHLTLLLILKLGSLGYAVVLLATIGLARWLEDTPRGAVGGAEGRQQGLAS